MVFHQVKHEEQKGEASRGSQEFIRILRPAASASK
jgi:hypothetical protein